MLRQALPTLALIALLGPVMPAQNPVKNGDFEGKLKDWTLLNFDDPLGTTGVRTTDVNGTGDSSLAVFADFKTLTGVRSATYESTPFKLKLGAYPITADASWQKLVTAPVPNRTLNKVEFYIVDTTTNGRLFNQRVVAPGQTGLIERATFNGIITIPKDGTYKLQIHLRHSNLAGIPFICHVDDVAIGEFGATCSAGGSAATGGTLELKLKGVFATKSKRYFVGTSLGSGPIPIDTRRIGLTPDSLLVLSTSGLAPGVFKNYAAIMGGSGNIAKLAIPATPALAGVKIHSAFVTVDLAAPSGILTISNTNITEIQ